MPRNVRNWWIETSVDGNAGLPKGTGPQAKDGGFTTTIYQRNRGQVTSALRITGREWNGELILEVEHQTQGIQPLGDSGFRIVTER
jgi:hypothetical protein